MTGQGFMRAEITPLNRSSGVSIDAWDIFRESFFRCHGQAEGWVSSLINHAARVSRVEKFIVSLRCPSTN